MASRIRENMDFNAATAAGSLATEVFTPWVPLALAGELHGQGWAVAGAAAQTLTGRIQTATDSVGTGAAVYGAPVVATSTAAGPLTVQVSAEVSGAPAAATHARFGLVSSAAINGMGALIRGQLRYSNV